MSAMTASERRQQIARLLSASQAPISATTLSQELGVSRQIIVGDIALLRAAGQEITATARGYVDPPHKMACCAASPVRTLPGRHGTSSTPWWTAAVPWWTSSWSTRSTGSLLLPAPVQPSGRGSVHEAHGRGRPLSQLTGGVHLHPLLPGRDRL